MKMNKLEEVRAVSSLEPVCSVALCSVAYEFGALFVLFAGVFAAPIESVKHESSGLGNHIRVISAPARDDGLLTFDIKQRRSQVDRGANSPLWLARDSSLEFESKSAPSSRRQLAALENSSNRPQEHCPRASQRFQVAAEFARPFK